ncbi:hypothetical protein FZEAL_1298 [Fusarium zealandicum]|uniref:Uncharacterized protein n=1 Tax=Fusarium zealandicum TaxID=1053134 RepID=A0A8H4UTR6_9HYPO|nr:hypothetical protein FZEAL_1298 [Fusarium zealandicum]
MYELEAQNDNIHPDDSHARRRAPVARASCETRGWLNCGAESAVLAARDEAELEIRASLSAQSRLGSFIRKWSTATGESDPVVPEVVYCFDRDDNGLPVFSVVSPSYEPALTPSPPPPRENSGWRLGVFTFPDSRRSPDSQSSSDPESSTLSPTSPPSPRSQPSPEWPPAPDWPLSSPTPSPPRERLTPESDRSLSSAYSEDVLARPHNRLVSGSESLDRLDLATSATDSVLGEGTGWRLGYTRSGRSQPVSDHHLEAHIRSNRTSPVSNSTDGEEYEVVSPPSVSLVSTSSHLSLNSASIPDS